MRCHGYVLLNSQQEDDLQRFTGEPFERPNDFRKMPILALVKDYIDSETAFLPRMIPKMMKNIHTYHKSGIFIGDVRRDNYLDGTLFDLSRAHTVPHPELTHSFIKEATQIGMMNDVPSADYHAFDCMIDVWNDHHPHEYIWLRFLPNSEYKGKLRGFDSSPEERHKRIMRRRAILYHRPELYKWQE